MKDVYYNDVDPNACAWTEELMRRGLIPEGDVDCRSIELVQPGDVAGYVQCHFFCGLSGWAYAARLAQWPDERPLWTGSCPCQPFSRAGKRCGTADRRHLWPHLFRLIRACRPAAILGEQVAQKAGWDWFDGVRADLAGEAYQCRGIGLCSCAVDSPDERERIYWGAVADDHGGGAGQIRNMHQAVSDQAAGRARADDGAALSCRDHDRDRPLVDDPRHRRGEGGAEPGLHGGRGAAAGADAPGLAMGHGDGAGLSLGQGIVGDACEERPAAGGADDAARSFYADHEWIDCHDGKKRRAKSGSSMLAARLPGRIPLWRGFGGSINAQIAAQAIAAFREMMDDTP